MGFSTFPNNPFPPSTAQFEEGKNDTIQAEIDAMKDGTNIDSFGDVESALALKANTADMTTALATKTNLSNIAPTFDGTSGVYAVGDKVIYDGVLYEFTSAHSTAGEWDESEAQPVKVSELVDALKSGLTKVATLTDNIHIDTQKGSLYRTAPIPVTCDSAPTDIVVSVTRASGAIIGAMVHSVSGTTVNVIIWATEETQEEIKVVLFYR